MKQRLGRIFMIAGIIFILAPDIMSVHNINQYQDALLEYWPLFLIVIGYFFLGSNSSKKSHR